MARVIQDQGPEAIEKRIGVDATGMRFNSIVSVEIAQKLMGGPEINPLVNPGAITATSMVQGATADAVWQKIIGTHNDFAGRELKVVQDVYKSESDTNQRNQAIGMLMYAYEFIKSNPQQATISTRGSARSASTRRTWPRWRRRSLSAARTRSPASRRSIAEGAVRARGDGHRRPLRRLRQVAVSHRPAGEERRRRRLIAVSPASSASPSSRRRSTRRATASARSGRSRTSRTRSAAIRT
jgi:hypothetical protein